MSQRTNSGPRAGYSSPPGHRSTTGSRVENPRQSIISILDPKIVQGLKSTYKRYGTLNLVAALEVATGPVKTAITQLKRREEFLQFMDQVVAEPPAEQELHVIMDNYCTHKKRDAWLARPPKVHFHFTPTSASWLNQVEIWFGILSRKPLRGLSTKSTVELGAAIEAFIAAYAQHAKPFKWRKREVKGSRLRNTIVTLCK